MTVAVRSNGGCKGHGLENIKGFKFETSHNGGFLVEAGKRALLELSSPGTDTAAWYHAAAIANTLGVEVAVEPLLEKIYQVSSDDFSMQSAGTYGGCVFVVLFCFVFFCGVIYHTLHAGLDCHNDCIT